MICAAYVDQGAGLPPAIVPTANQPTDFSSCQVVLLTGGDSMVLSSFSLPQSADIATAWGWGFTLVVGCYAISWCVGAVVNFLNGK